MHGIVHLSLLVIFPFLTLSAAFFDSAEVVDHRSPPLKIRQRRVGPRPVNRGHSILPFFSSSSSFSSSQGKNRSNGQKRDPHSAWSRLRARGAPTKQSQPPWSHNEVLWTGQIGPLVRHRLAGVSRSTTAKTKPTTTTTTTTTTARATTTQHPLLALHAVTALRRSHRRITPFSARSTTTTPNPMNPDHWDCAQRVNLYEARLLKKLGHSIRTVSVHGRRVHEVKMNCRATPAFDVTPAGLPVTPVDLFVTPIDLLVTPGDLLVPFVTTTTTAVPSPHLPSVLRRSPVDIRRLRRTDIVVHKESDDFSRPKKHAKPEAKRRARRRRKGSKQDRNRGSYQTLSDNVSVFTAAVAKNAKVIVPKRRIPPNTSGKRH